MLELKDDCLQQILPGSIADDKTVQDIAKAIGAKLQHINRQTELILLLPRLDELSEALIDELAWQYHVDFYDYQADIVKKRALVRNAIAWHRYKSTPAAVEEVCSAVFQSAKVFEWWEYGGEPYHFQVRLIALVTASTDVIINGKGAGRVGDSYAPHGCVAHPTHSGVIASGSASVFINGKAAGRIGDSVSCGGSVAVGSSDVMIGG